MLKIYLARHGQDQDNAAGILNGQRNQPLTDLGLSQAKKLAETIKENDLTFDKVYSSPLDRAFVTAQKVCEALDIDQPEKLQGLIERDFGVMTGKRIDQIEEMCGQDIIKAEKITYFLSPEGAETFPELLDRAKKVLEEVKAKHKDGNILLVCHGDLGKMIYTAYYNLDWEEILKMFHFGNSELLLLSEDSSANQAHVFEFEQHNA